MNRHLHPACMAITYLDIAINHHRAADKAHRAHADIIAQFGKFSFQCSDFRVRIFIANHAQTGRPFSQDHTGIFCPAQPNAYNGWLTGKTALAKGHQTIQIKPLYPLNPVRGEQHPVICAKQAALMNGYQVNPFAVRLKRIFNFRCANSHIIIMVGAP